MSFLFVSRAESFVAEGKYFSISGIPSYREPPHTYTEPDVASNLFVMSSSEGSVCVFSSGFSAVFSMNLASRKYPNFAPLPASNSLVRI